MTRDELVEELLPITRNFINQKRLSDAGLRTMLRYLLTKIELSKLHQPAVIKNEVAVCDYCSTPLTKIKNDDVFWCTECGNLYKQTVL